jgi:hypothetical protein
MGPRRSVLGRIFAINFVFGVVTGIPMEFEFGTNWARISRLSGGVIGQPARLQRKTRKRIPPMSNSESDRNSIRAPDGVRRSASTAARSSISETVDLGTDPAISCRLVPWITIAAQPAGPGLPMAEPSVKMKNCLFMGCSGRVVSRISLALNQPMPWLKN